MSGLDTAIAILVATVGAGTPLVYAALGELVVEKSGVLNLGVEGMMLMGAIAGFATAVIVVEVPWLAAYSVPFAVVAGAFSGALMALVFAILTLTFLANQVATGLALTIFGIGLSAFLGLDYTSVALGEVGVRVPPVHVPGLSDIPVLGPALFSFDFMVYFSLVMFGLISWFLYRTRPGLVLRGVGEAPQSAHALGYSVIGVRYLAVLFGGAMAGLGGVYLSVAYSPMWVEAMTAGRGWIALALVVFATWRPGRVMLGAYLFGGVTIAQFHVQGTGFDVPSQFLSMLPYLATIVVLVAISRDVNTIRLNAPASLAIAFHPDS